MQTNLIQKYTRQVPRYTSYPTVPAWNGAPTFAIWMNEFKDAQNVDLYIHVPYCLSLCYYCGCNKKVTKNRTKGSEYVDLLLKEWNLYLKKNKEIKINSIHFGGGTPNFLYATDLKRLLEILSLNFSDDFIGAIEVDPRSISEEQISVLGQYKFKRVSMGIQDFSPVVQEKINRIQPFERVKKVTEEFRKNGFESINFDLIYGLPGQSDETIKDSFQKTISLWPDMIAYYSYAHLPNKFPSQRLFHDKDLPNAALKKHLFLLGSEFLNQNDYMAIGLDHFARKGSYLNQAFEKGTLMRSFMGYTDKKAPVTLGLGVSAISSTNHFYVQNPIDVKDYESQLSDESLSFTKGHCFKGEDHLRDEIIQTLMCQKRISESGMAKLADFETISAKLEVMQNDGLLTKMKSEWQVSQAGGPYLRVIAALFDEYLGDAHKKGIQFSSSI